MLGDPITDFLTRVRDASTDVQNAANAVAQKVAEGGDFAVRASNATTGAAAGAKAGSSVPPSFNIPPAVLYGAAAFAVYKLLRR